MQNPSSIKSPKKKEEEEEERQCLRSIETYRLRRKLERRTDRAFAGKNLPEPQRHRRSGCRHFRPNPYFKELQRERERKKKTKKPSGVGGEKKKR